MKWLIAQTVAQLRLVINEELPDGTKRLASNHKPCGVLLDAINAYARGGFQAPTPEGPSPPARAAVR